MAIAQQNLETGVCVEERRRAFLAFVDGRRDSAVRLAFRLLGGDTAAAEDVAQEAFLRAYRGLGRFREEASLSTWFYRILLREVHRHLVVEHLVRQHHLVDGRLVGAELQLRLPAHRREPRAIPHPGQHPAQHLLLRGRRRATNRRPEAAVQHARARASGRLFPQRIDCVTESSTEERGVNCEVQLSLSVLPPSNSQSFGRWSAGFSLTDLQLTRR